MIRLFQPLRYDLSMLNKGYASCILFFLRGKKKITNEKKKKEKKA
jgi:hypothetical protein